MNFPLIIFAFILLMYSIGVAFVWYHLYKFGIGMGPKIILAIFLVGSVALVGLNVSLFYNVDWNFILDQLLGGSIFNFPI